VTLRLVFRSYGPENRKGRPDYYSKLTCLVSFVRAAEPTGASLVFINNGPVPDDRTAVMRASAGEIVHLPGLGMQQSYLTALRHAIGQEWDPEDVVYFSEDDYLYHPDALTRLEQAARALPEVDYFALYAGTPGRVPEGDPTPRPGFPRGWRDLRPWDVDGQDWTRVRSTAATFGGRVGALTEDYGIFRFCTVPHRTMFRDEDTHLLLQGFEPYPYRRLLADALGRSTAATPRDRFRDAALAPFRLATNLRAHRRPERRRLLVGAAPNLAAHLELGHITPGRDWAAVARDAGDWGVARGLVRLGAPAS
jgi:hypothetical protein